MRAAKSALICRYKRLPDYFRRVTESAFQRLRRHIQSAARTTDIPAVYLVGEIVDIHEVVPEILRRSNLISDYTFAKDRLFAHLNLKGDELEMYERVHAILAEKIPTPDLIVYLRADTDVLMARIAIRARPYERNMDRDYIDAVRAAYERFFARYDQAPVLPIDTNELDFVRRPEDLDYIVLRIRSVLRKGVYQAPLPEIA